MLNLKRMHFPIDVILVCTGCYAAYPLSQRHIEEMMDERGVSVTDSSITRWAIGSLSLLERMTRKHNRQLAAAGEWMRRTSKSTAFRNTSTALSTSMGLCGTSSAMTSARGSGYASIHSNILLSERQKWLPQRFPIMANIDKPHAEKVACFSDDRLQC